MVLYKSIKFYPRLREQGREQLLHEVRLVARAPGLELLLAPHRETALYRIPPASLRKSRILLRLIA